MAHQESGLTVLTRVQDDLAEVAKVEQFPTMEGRQLTMVIAPQYRGAVLIAPQRSCGSSAALGRFILWCLAGPLAKQK